MTTTDTPTTASEVAVRVRDFCRALKARVVSVSGPGARDLLERLDLPYEVKVDDEQPVS